MAAETPIILFAFSRLDTTQRVLEALSHQSIPVPRIIAFCDAARNETEKIHIQRVRDLILSVTWTTVELIERKHNFGTARNIITGLDDVFQRYDSAVIVEDDVLVVSHFYEAMCYLLDSYEAEKTVFSVGGYPSLLSDALPDYPYDAIVSPRFSAWGWATWANRWQEISPSVASFVNPFAQLKDLPLGIRSMLNLVAKHPQKYWDIPLSLMCVYKGYFHVLSYHYMVNNIGLQSGVHGYDLPVKLTFFFQQHNQLKDKMPITLPSPHLRMDVVQSIQAYLDSHARASQVKVLGLPISDIFRRLKANVLKGK
jgi:hypothetical protein